MAVVEVATVEIKVVWEGAELRFARPDHEVRLGSAGDNDWVLPCAGVSRHHAVARWEPARLRLRDLASKNGLVCGGRRHSEVLLEEGQEVALGRARLAWVQQAQPPVRMPGAAGANELWEGAVRTLSTTLDVLGEGAPAQLRRSVAFVRELSQEELSRPAELIPYLDRLAALIDARSVQLLTTVGPTESGLLAVGGGRPSVAALAALQSAVETRQLRASVAEPTGEEVWLIARHSRRQVALAALLPIDLSREEWRELTLVVAAELLGRAV